ncbi:unnamed protein product [Paramecium sonneborni]|uniref:Uncharacterized protein n=1 Tax=Paramecium sonneborni TaxID=65129 RepID=A0A8S1RW07_9CILI|nr:unnamed protein product [Paramecium sonneborni]
MLHKQINQDQLLYFKKDIQLRHLKKIVQYCLMRQIQRRKKFQAHFKVCLIMMKNHQKLEISIQKKKIVYLNAINLSTFQGRAELPFLYKIKLLIIILNNLTQIKPQIILRKVTVHKQILLKSRRQILQLHKESQQISEKFFLDKKELYRIYLLYLITNFYSFLRHIQDEQVKAELIIVCLEIIYCNPFEHKVLRDLLYKNILQKIQGKFLLLKLAKMVYFNDIKIINSQLIQLWKNFQEQHLNFIQLFLHKFQEFNNFRKKKLIISILSKRIILCQGDYCTCKTTTVLKLASLMNQKCLLVSIHDDLEIDDLLGNFSLINQNNEIIDEYLINKQKQYEKQKSPKMKHLKEFKKYVIGQYQIISTRQKQKLQKDQILQEKMTLFSLLMNLVMIIEF